MEIKGIRLVSEKATPPPPASGDMSKYKKVNLQAKAPMLHGVKVDPKPHDARSYFSSNPKEKCIYSKSNVYQNIGYKKDDLNYGVAGALWAAYNTHSDVILTPDDVWLTILHGFSLHVINNSKKLQSYFVSHEGKKDLEVFVGENPQIKKNWDEVISAFQAALGTAVKAEAAKAMECDFSTSGPIEKAISGVGTMSTFQNYFTYKCYTSCGIRNLYFAGTLDDWKKVREKTAGLAKYEYSRISSSQVAILDKFIETYEGKVDLDFWNKIAHVVGPDGGSGANFARLTGWISSLLPYTSEGKPSTSEIALCDIPECIFTVPFILIIETGKSFNYKFKGGFTGLLLEGEAFRPQISYAVIKQFILIGTYNQQELWNNTIII